MSIYRAFIRIAGETLTLDLVALRAACASGAFGPPRTMAHPAYGAVSRREIEGPYRKLAAGQALPPALVAVDPSGAIITVIEGHAGFAAFERAGFLASPAYAIPVTSLSAYAAMREVTLLGPALSAAPRSEGASVCGKGGGKGGKCSAMRLGFFSARTGASS
jgi:hypothetical protein